MLQNTYTLPDLIDLALKVPEVGAVNFNILHTVLQAMVKELRISDVRPWCNVEDALLAKAAITKAKLRQAEPHRVLDPYPGESKRDTSDETSEKTTPKPPERKDSTVQTEEIATPEKTEILLSELEEHPVVTGDDKLEDESKEPSEMAESTKDSDVVAGTVPEKSIEETPAAPEESSPRAESEEPAAKSGRGRHMASDAVKYTNLNMRVGALEEALHRLSNIVDMIADKIRKAELRKKSGGPSSEELEAIDDRLLEVEEALARYAKDHDLLMKINDTLENLLREFEEIKALAALLKQMQIDLSKKADKEETRAALELKADLVLVHTKVSQEEFETAIEELGEAIGLLGIKFTRKNEEWEERAAALWKAVDGKMTLDVFEAARVKIESRLTALLFGLKRLKRVVEDLLYPESSGVTRCILCRRPACISGLECLGAGESLDHIPYDGDSGEPDRKEIFLSSSSTKKNIPLDSANDSSTPQN